MYSDLQQLVDHLGNRLGRSVAIDDPHIRLLAYNAHDTEIDAVRVGSIMRRRVSPSLTSHLQDLGVLKADDVFTVPARPDIGLTVERIGMPIRRDQVLLGFIWLAGSDGPVTEEHVAALREAAGHAALIMARKHLAGEQAKGREAELLRDLLSDEPALHADAAEELIEQESLVPGDVTVLVATVSRDRGEPLSEQDRLALGAAVEHGRRRLPPRGALTFQRSGHSLLIAVTPARGNAGEAAMELGAVMHERLVAESERDVDTCWIGVGEPRCSLRDLRRSYQEALRAAEIASATTALGPVAQYSKLGVYALLSQLSAQQVSDALHPGVRSLLNAGQANDDLIETLTVYLDSAGDAKRAVATLHIHRTTLYYRLKRIQELTGLDLSLGDDRLSAHLSLKAARLLQAPRRQKSP
ncbi:PucR family transcriptional regulator [Amycolatopsis thailandensis]|uniref:PucR family transcriptional regulator n=1 Tax=Amycolatopsis thailandensis TaxID=589330 RepID=UPI00363C1455